MDESTREQDERVASMVRRLMEAKFLPAAMPIERRQLLNEILAAELEADDGTSPATGATPSVDEIYVDPAASHWLRECLASAMTRDPVDAANDAAVLALAPGRRAKELIEAAFDRGKE